MQQILGKLNQEAYMIRYKGATTDTANVTVDNLKSLISVDVNTTNIENKLKRDFYTKAEVDAMIAELMETINALIAKNYVEDVSEETDKVYGRKQGEWVEIASEENVDTGASGDETSQD